MSFSTTIFLFAFLPLTLLGYYLIDRRFKNGFLVAASLFFYAWGEPNFILLLVISILVNYLIGICMERNLERAEELKQYSTWKPYQRKAKSWLTFGLIFNFGLLFYFKYLLLSIRTIGSLLPFDFTLPVIGLPLGISFFTFRTVSYCLDIYWRTEKAQKNLFNMALYISFFPQVIMGPIVKYSDFARQLQERKGSLELFAEGVMQIILGLFKKIFFADGLATMVDTVFTLPHPQRTVLMAWMGIIGYLIQLYYDFSGYSDMAIGLGKLFGFHTPRNFDYPYVSKSVVDFWNRWHMTLGTWLKDYIYTPVFRAMQKKKKLSLFGCNIVALFATWLFSGAWHGSAWHYIAMGLYYFAFIAFERTVEDRQKKRRKRLGLKKQPETRLHAVIAHVYCFFAVVFGQLMFRIEGFWNFFPYAAGMFGLLGNSLTNALTSYYWSQNMVLLIVGGIFCFPVSKKINELCTRSQVGSSLRFILRPIAYAGMAVVAIALVFTSTYQAFIYFQF